MSVMEMHCLQWNRQMLCMTASGSLVRKLVFSAIQTPAKRSCAAAMQMFVTGKGQCGY